MRRLALLVLSLALAIDALAGGVPAQDQATIDRLVKALKAGDRAAVAALVQYPLMREQPLAPIRDKAELVASFGDFFDATTTAQVIKDSTKPWFNWQGTAIGSGLVWISQGEIIRLSLTTEAQKAKAADEKAKQSQDLHPSVAQYDHLLLECWSDRHHLRLYDLAGRVYYAAWLRGVALKHAPDIKLIGTMSVEGSAGNRSFDFRNGEYAYLIDDPRVCADSCDPKLTIMKGKELVRTEICKRTP